MSTPLRDCSLQIKMGKREEFIPMLNPMVWSTADGAEVVMKMPLNCCNPGFELHVMAITLMKEPLVASQAGSKGRSALQH